MANGMNKPRVWAAVGVLLALVAWHVPAHAATATLSWSANGESDLAGYTAYWGTSSGSYSGQADVGNVTSYPVTGLSEDTTYYFAVKAYDTSGNFSGYSNEVSLTVPAGTGGGDTTPPAVSSVSTTSSTTVEVVFSEQVDTATAEDPANYSIDGGAVQVLAAVLDSDGVTVRLTTAAQNADAFHTLGVSGVLDLASPPNATSTQVSYQVVFDLQVTVSAPSGYDAFPVTAGDTYYVDRSFTVDQIPAAYQGAQWVRTANSDKSDTTTDLVTFSVDRDVIVFVGYDRRASSGPDWLTGAFVPSGEGPATTDAASPFTMWARDYPAGDVVLGGNQAAGASGASSNYIVLVIPMIGTVTGDADGDLMPDAWESATGTDPAQFDAHDDPDGDGLTNLQEYWQGSDPLTADTGQTPGNNAPTVALDGSVIGVVGQQVALDASGATDPDGDALTFSWRQILGPQVNVANANQAIAAFTPQETGLYGFAVTVRDGNGGVAASTTYAEVFDNILLSTVTDLGANLVVSQGSEAGAMLSIPNGGLDKTYTVAIGVRPMPAALPSTLKAVSDALHFSPSNILLASSATIRVPYKGASSQDSLHLMRYDPDADAWEETTVSRDLGTTLEANVATLGTFVVAKDASGKSGGHFNGTAAGGGCTAAPAPGNGDLSLLLLAALGLARALRPGRRSPRSTTRSR